MGKWGAPSGERATRHGRHEIGRDSVSQSLNLFYTIFISRKKKYAVCTHSPPVCVGDVTLGIGRRSRVSTSTSDGKTDCEGSKGNCIRVVRLFGKVGTKRAPTRTNRPVQGHPTTAFRSEVAGDGSEVASW